MTRPALISPPTYATHPITGEGFDVTFVQLQPVHEHAATT